jgi:hypothetical protein
MLCLGIHQEHILQSESKASKHTWRRSIVERSSTSRCLQPVVPAAYHVGLLSNSNDPMSAGEILCSMVAATAANLAAAWHSPQLVPELPKANIPTNVMFCRHGRALVQESKKLAATVSHKTKGSL